LRTRAIPERLRGVFTTRRYTDPRSPYLTLPQGSLKLADQLRETIQYHSFYSLILRVSDEWPWSEVRVQRAMNLLLAMPLRFATTLRRFFFCAMFRAAPSTRRFLKKMSFIFELEYSKI